MRKLIVPHVDLLYTEKTSLDADYSSGTALTVINNYGFAQYDWAIVGEPGEEKTETKDVTSQGGNTTLNISGALKFPHNKGVIVYRFEYNQLEISRYRGSSWTVISYSNIQWDKDETIYIDANGLSTDSYRYRLFNSVNSSASAYSPTIPGTGYPRASAGYMIREARRIAGDIERKIVKDDDELFRQLNKAQEIIGAVRNDWWFLLVDTYKASNGIPTVANQHTYSLAQYTDFGYMSTLRFKYNNGTNIETYALRHVPKIELEYDKRDETNPTTLTDDYVSTYTILPADSSSDQGYIRVDPTPKTSAYGTFYPDYYKVMLDLDDVIDETAVPLPSILEDFLLAYIYRLKGDETRAKIYDERFYGPDPGRDEKFKPPTGIRLLEQMQNSKNKALGQVGFMKTYKGRRAIRRLYQDRFVDRDAIVERYW